MDDFVVEGLEPEVDVPEDTEEAPAEAPADSVRVLYAGGSAVIPIEEPVAARVIADLAGIRFSASGGEVYVDGLQATWDTLVSPGSSVFVTNATKGG